VDGIATDSRGPYIDARRLEFLEECFDAEWQQYGYLPDPEVNAAAQLEVSWDIVFTAMKAALLLQSGADELFADALTRCLVRVLAIGAGRGRRKQPGGCRPAPEQPTRRSGWP
jgi:hypothetical protein